MYVAIGGLDSVFVIGNTSLSIEGILGLATI
jgi:hypothetical protein